MSRSLLTLLVFVSILVSPASNAHAQTGTPLCPDPSSPDCVVANWGQTGPDGVDSGMAPARGDPLASTTSAGRMTLKLMPVATSTSRAPASSVPLKSVVSPINLFPKETAALTSAIKQARFKPDGTIASGEERIAAAAAAAARVAGTRYTLTLYIKVPQRLKPDESGLNKKVQAINDVLLNSGDGPATGRPKS